MAKRGNNEGSIYKRTDGRWTAVVDLGWHAGRRRRKYLYGHTRREVQTKLTAALRARADGLPVHTERQTVGQYLDYWLNNAAKPRVRLTTYASYESLVRVHIVPALGRTQLHRLGPQQIQGFLNDKAASGLSSRTVRYLHTLLHAALAQAERWGLVPRNVAALVDRPRQDQKEVHPLGTEEALAFLAFVEGDRLEGLWTAALCLGLRRGEALGLTWADANLAERTIRIRQSLQRIDGTLQLVEPKTGGSNRTIPIPDVVVDALHRQRARQLEERLASGSLWQHGDLVFTTAVGTPLDGRNVTRRLQHLLGEAGLPRQTFHALRHGCASLLTALGVHPRVVMETLGHRQSDITMEVYSHVSAALQREAADKLDEFFRQAKERAATLSGEA